MSRPKLAVECPRPPVGFSREEAARFVGVSASTFGKMVEDGLMPPARRIYGRRVWDADQCQAFFRRLPQEGEPDHAADQVSPYAKVRA